MKKINFILISVILLASIACGDQLDQVPISTPTNAYKTPEDFQQAVNGIYNALSPNPGQALGNVQAINGYAIRRFEMSEIRSDNVNSSGTGVRDWNPVNNFEKTLATNPYINEAWYGNYVGILRANTVLDKINETAVPDEAMRNQIIGEAKFLRAFFYFDLVRWFGKVPLFDRVATPTQALEVSRTPVEEVYALIIADLDDASIKLPATYAATSRGRATSMAAKAMLGLVYLTRTGPTYGIEGPGLGTNEYAQAVSLFNEVIASGRYSWVTNYASIFSYNNEGNPDIVFDVQAVGGNSGDLGIGARFPTEMYEVNFANAIDLGFIGGVDPDSPKAPSNDFRISFEASDVRYAVSVLPSYTLKNGTVVNNRQFIKFFDRTLKPADRFNWSINYPIMRYTDVLLMKAEAIIRGGFGTLGTQADVDLIVNNARQRAGLGAVSNVTLTMLLNERRHEFAAEGLRWHDLVRNGVVLTVMSAWITAEGAGKIKAISANDIIYPIPQSQVTVKPGLYTQSPGYN